MALYMQSSSKIAQKKAQEAAEQREAEATQELDVLASEGKEVAETSEEGAVGAVEPGEVFAEIITILKHEDVEYTFSSRRGGLKYAEFLDQQEVGSSEANVRLNRFDEHGIGALVGGPDTFIDNGYRITNNLEDSSREIEYLGQTTTGLFVKKRWTFVEDTERGAEYRLKLQLTFENQGDSVVDLSDYGLFLGSAAALYQREWPQQTGFFYNQGGDFEYKKSDWLKKRDIFEKDVEQIYYAGVSNQFFATIVTPEVPYSGGVWAKSTSVELPAHSGGGDKIAVRGALNLPKESLAPKGGMKVLDYEVFVGPKRNPVLRSMDQDRGNVMNYGWFGWISSPLNRLLTFLHDKVFDGISQKWSWGLAIVALTIIIRTVMWPLQSKSTRSMKRMSKLQPEMAKLKEKFPDDQQKQQQEIMKLYREYNINPVGGCLPMLVQIPIFFGFYRMLQYAVELRQQKFLWVEDLSQPDTLATIPLPFSLPFLGSELPINVLPIVMSGTMVLQMALSPKTGDKMQQRIFMLMPLIFFFFCYNFASALALYWTTSNIFAIVQMLVMKRMPEPELKKSAKGQGKKGFMERMQERADQMQKMQEEAKRQNSGGAPKKPKKPRGPRTGG